MNLHIHDPICKLENHHTNINLLPANNFWQRVSLSCSRGEAKQLYLNNALHFWDKSVIEQSLRTVIDLLEPGGTLTIKDFDFLMLAETTLREISARDSLITHIVRCKWLWHMSQVKEMLKAFGIKLTNSFYTKEEVSFTLIGTKS